MKSASEEMERRAKISMTLKLKKDLSGKKFGRLLVLCLAERQKHGHSYWKCKCDCGRIVIVNGDCLRRGYTKSCGCLSLEKFGTGLGTLKHGDAKKGRRTKLYDVWVLIKQRCFNPSCPSFKHYGERGIDMYDQWRSSFEAFKTWALNNGYRQGLTIDRVNNNLGYRPDNCQWISRSENAKKAWADRLRGNHA